MNILTDIVKNNQNIVTEYVDSPVKDNENTARESEALLNLSSKLPIQCDFFDTDIATNCFEKIKDALIESINKMGYQYLRYTCWVNGIASETSITNSFSINISNFPTQWESYYEKNNLYMIDPVVRLIQDNILKNNLIFHGTWDSAYDTALANPLGATDEQKVEYVFNVSQLIKSSREHELKSGYYYSWGDQHRRIVISISSHNDYSADTEIKSTNFINLLHSMAVLVNQAITMTNRCDQCIKSFRVDGSDPIKLSAAELQILRLYKSHRNASIKQIAAIYNRSIDTVNHHLRTIRSKLDLPGASGYALALYASELNLL